jgi:hypothetical protein
MVRRRSKNPKRSLPCLRCARARDSGLELAQAQAGLLRAARHLRRVMRRQEVSFAGNSGRLLRKPG